MPVAGSYMLSSTFPESTTYLTPGIVNDVSAILVNFNEFFHGIFDLVRDYEETANSSDESNDSLEASAKVLFTQLDKDGDGYLSAVELLPIIGKLHPSEHHYASQQTDYILQENCGFVITVALSVVTLQLLGGTLQLSLFNTKIPMSNLPPISSSSYLKIHLR
ncbi:Calcium-binding EF hand family protein [Perilla frutescens var. hirtella]|nr:Calcium-binding EF hand family protein [Perilla frutescens var. hirtella]KAH6806098.1 Calcium-binding EF hand family protein [Perilla frutescens var. frutescens]